MKKLSLLMLVIMTSLSVILAGCGQNDKQSKEQASDDKTLRVVTNADYAPFESLEGDKVVGFDVDFVQALAEGSGIQG